MIYNNGWTTKTFEEAIAEELTIRNNEPKTFYTAVFHYLKRGLYWEQLDIFLKWFPIQNIKIFVVEKYDNHEQIYNEIYEFLNLKIPNKKNKLYCRTCWQIF